MRSATWVGLVMLLHCGCAGAGREPAAPAGFWVQQPMVGADCPSGTELWFLDPFRRSMVAADYPQPAPAVGRLPPDGMNVSASGPDGDRLVSWTRLESYRLCYRVSGDGAEPRCVQMPIAAWCQRPDGVHHGPYIEWYWDGELAVMGTFVDGREQGLWKYWDRSGRLVEERRYVAGRRERPPGWATEPVPAPAL